MFYFIEKRIPHLRGFWRFANAYTSLKGSKELYFVLTCGDSIGNAGAYAKKLCASKGLIYMGCVPVVMPENYIALFRAPSKDEALKIIGGSGDQIRMVSQLIKNREAYLQPFVTLRDRINSGIVNDLFYPVFVHAKKFHATQACISCGKCEAVCPLKNIHLEKGKPVWENHCTHCMACICRCPREAIEYGRHSRGKARYTCPERI